MNVALNYSNQMYDKGYRTSDSRNSKPHSQKFTTDKLQCPHCDNRATGFNDLKWHLHKHTDDMLQCPHCDNRTTRSNDLKRHLRKNTD